ncbi:uncharacterized protein LOC110704044 [Chenopodium quinoa]|uniref:uncharacterized protein LOC110704044 n=1 Tax=Chenopodium quinoa TaxID=63459 RepID=UPI000B77756E|nr:uncharacterized protein LOC110704044 [Chenopodium quinoa]
MCGRLLRRRIQCGCGGFMLSTLRTMIGGSTSQKNAGWAWKKLCQVKDRLKEGFNSAGWLGNVYSISKVYKWIQGPHQDVSWYPWVWNRFNIPKQGFILWMDLQDRLRTRSLLVDWGVCQDNVCLLCGNAVESREHLFFDCDYSRKCLSGISEWLGIPETDFSIDRSWKQWGKEVKDSIKRKICLAALAAMVYQIWYVRNKALWLKVVIHPRVVCKVICTEVIQRCKQMINCRWRRQHCKWLHSLQSTSCR